VAKRLALSNRSTRLPNWYVLREVLDVAADIRPESKPMVVVRSRIVICRESTQFLIPRGFTTDFLVLSETATFFYKCDTIFW
jgi:dTDP-4-dehydrorhamnose 3,5-epimerase